MVGFLLKPYHENSMKPRIAIPLPTGNDLDYNRRNWQAYADSVLSAGADPIQFPLDLSARQALELAQTCQAILLPGSPADVDPATYGQPRDPATAPADPARETTDHLLLEDSFHTRRPILGICFGQQILNVFRGGTLVQDLTVLPVNHEAGSSVAVAHSAGIAPESLLATIVDPAEAPLTEGFLRLPINSSHHQSAGIAGYDLKVSARCPQDGVVEAIEGPYDPASETRHFVLGVQWHPERSTLSSASSRALFGRLTQEATLWKPSL